MKIVAALLAFAAAANAEIGADQETQLRAEIAETKAQLAELRDLVSAPAEAAKVSQRLERKAMTSAKEMLESAQAEFEEDRRRLASDQGLVYADETIIEDTFVSTTLVNASSMTLAGADVGKVLAEYKVRLNVLDQYLKTADVTKYYRYYFGITMYDGGRARDNVASYSRMYNPYGMETVNIGGTWYAFVTSYYDDTVTVLNASSIKPGASQELYNELPKVSEFWSGTDSEVSSNLDGPWGIKHAHISGTDYLFVACYDSDGVMMINASNPQDLSYVNYIDDSDDNYDKLGNPRELTIQQIGGRWYLFVTSYSVQTSSYGGNGVQVIDVTDPYNPSSVASLVDGTDNFKCLNNPWGIDSMWINGQPFVFVAGYGDNCIQIIDVSDPSDPVAAYSYIDMQDTYSYLASPVSVKGFEVNNKYYVLANAFSDNCVVVIDVTNPYSCSEASSMAFSSSKSSNGLTYYGIGDDTNVHPKMDVYTTTDVFGRQNTFAVILGHYSYGSMQLADLSNPEDPIPVGWIQGQTSASQPYYMMYYYPSDIKVISMTDLGVEHHYALVTNYYGSDSSSYPNGVQVIKLDPVKSW